MRGLGCFIKRVDSSSKALTLEVKTTRIKDSLITTFWLGDAYARMKKRTWQKDKHWSLGTGLETDDNLDAAYDVYATRSKWEKKEEKRIWIF